MTAAAVLVAAAVLLSFIGAIIASSGSLRTASAYHGGTWAGLGLVLAVLAVGALRLARTDPGLWSQRRDLVVGSSFAGLAILLGLVGVIVDHAAGVTRAQASGPVWSGFGLVWAFTAFGWLVYTKPVLPPRAMLMAAVAAGVAIVLAIIGLAMGLGDSTSDFVHSAGWFSWASIWALLAVSVVFGRRRQE